jgi:hypothetical protein
MDILKLALKDVPHREHLEALVDNMISEGLRDASEREQLIEFYRDPVTFELYFLRDLLLKAGALNGPVDDIKLRAVHSGCFNAYACLLPDGTREILMNAGVTILMQQVAHCLKALTSWYSDAPFDKTLDIGGWVNSVLDVAFFIKYYPHGLITDTPFYRANIEFDSNTSWQAEMCVMFVLAHEYGHHMLGHLGTKAVRALPGSGHSVEVEVYHHSCEYEADRFALESIIKYDESVSVSDAVWTVAPFFLLANLADQMAEPLTSPTHPPSMQRLERLIADFSVDRTRIDHLKECFQEISRSIGTIYEFELDDTGKPLGSVLYEAPRPMRGTELPPGWIPL